MTAAEAALLDTLLTVATDAARRTAVLLLDAVDGPRTVDRKSTSTDLVTEMDRAAEALIVGAILETRPDDGLLGEEGSDRTGTTGVRWIIDPVDGTTNYVYGHPGWGVSIGAELDGELVMGVVADPTHGDLYTAARGAGAYCNDVADPGLDLCGPGPGPDRDRVRIRSRSAAGAGSHDGRDPPSRA